MFVCKLCFNPLTSTVVIWDYGYSFRVPGCQKLQMTSYLAWHRMYPYGNSGHQRVNLCFAHEKAFIFVPICYSVSQNAVDTLLHCILPLALQNAIMFIVASMHIFCAFQCTVVKC